MIEKRVRMYPGSNRTFESYVGEVDGVKTVVFVKTSIATTLDNISYYAGQEYKKGVLGSVAMYGWDKTETTSRENMFYRFDLMHGTQQTVGDEATRKFIENFVASVASETEEC